MKAEKVAKSIGGALALKIGAEIVDNFEERMETLKDCDICDVSGSPDEWVYCEEHEVDLE